MKQANHAVLSSMKNKERENLMPGIAFCSNRLWERLRKNTKII